MSASVERLSKVRDVLMGKTYELSLVKTYVARWGLAQAVRELIQNALDSDSPFVYEFISELDGLWTLRLNSEFASLTPQTLLLGSTSKSTNEDAIGSFGEGYKIALLVLTREGYDVDVFNGDLVWRPRFRMSRAFGEEVLVIDESFAPDKTNRGLTFMVHGLSEDDVEAIRGSCLLMQETVGALKRTQFGDILLDQPGKLYVGGLYICDTGLKYGYNIKPKFITLERDRQTVSSWDLKDTTLKCWYDTGENERVARMISEEVADVEYSRYDAPELVKEECYKIFRANNPGAIIASSPEEAKKKIEQGMTKTVYCGVGMFNAVSNSRSYRSELPSITVAQVAPHVALAAFLSAHKGEMRRPAIAAFKALILEAQRKWRLDA
jgi:hypothetical protein